jgi:hypothetical protein
MKKEYDLESEGMQFKKDFNFGFESVLELLRVFKGKSQFKKDLVKDEKGKIFLVSRSVDFEKNKAYVEMEDISEVFWVESGV